MAEATLIARVRPDENDPDLLVVESPAVGMADGAPPAGQFLNPLDRVITLTILGRRHVLRLPRDVHGRITEVLLPRALTPLAFAQPIARLDPRALGAAGRAPDAAGGGPAGAGQGDLITVTAPTDGIFYSRPSREAPAYVEVGSEVSTGSVLGLVEVMKSFNPIAYGGPGLPQRGEVAAILAEDASEVTFGQPLFTIRPPS